MATRNRKRKFKFAKRSLGVALAVVLAFFLLVLLIRFSGARDERKQVKEGIKYLKSIDTDKQLDKAESQVKKMRTESISQELENAFKGESGQVNPWSYFNDSVIMGDSRAVGFAVYEYLPYSRVLADGGNTIKTISDSFDTLSALNPSVVFLCYGLNDATSAYWDSTEDWIKDYDSQIKKLQKRLPEATICVNSILPATDKAKETSERVELIPDYDKALKEYCDQNKITYVDCNPLVEDHRDMIEPSDGFHYKKTFYPLWAAEMIMTVYADEGD